MKKKLNIAIFTDTFLPQINGIVTATINLAKGLADRGHKIYIICPRFKIKVNEFKYKNVKIMRLSSIPAYFYEDFRFTSPFIDKNLLKLLEKEKIDLIHFHTPLPLGIQAISISKILKIPLIGTFHTLFSDPQYLKNVGMNFKIAEKIAWEYAKLYYNRCDLIICPTEAIKKELLSKKFKQPIKAISNGIDLSIFRKNKQNKKRGEYIEDDEKLILYFGRIAHGKNMNYLIDCFNIVLKKLPKTKLLIIGGGPQLKELKKYVESLNIQNKIIFTGAIPHNKLLKSSIISSCDLFVTASTTETQSLTILEAQASGLPCIGINERGVKNVIKNNKTGILVKNNDKIGFAKAIIKLLTNKRIYNQMKKNISIEIKKQDIKNIAPIF